ncbi:ferredoxin-type protein NapF [Sulfurospirillum oryzae]|uniref:ferredoxin-type protein NapF n=1 Tax=Sulfurospirillum oryzae TaxID=2976535 RepID=UPI0021E8045D|nr:ferredoxin-type protein NapF [Sulfurospirillum oryzae]
MTDGSRRGVFASLFGKKKAQKNQNELCVRPPYHQEGYEFLDHCVTCKDTPCMEACEENIILLDATTHTPCVDFTKGGCTFCEACARACPNDVLSLSCNDEKNLHVKAEIDIMACMAWHQSLCNSCLDTCEPRAIHFLGLWKPTIEIDQCIGCGMCIGICPSDAIRIKEEGKA